MSGVDKAAFEAELRRDGFEVEAKDVPERPTTPEHEHPFDVRALVLEGGITLTVAGQATRYGSGQVFTMPAGCRHAEAIGPEGMSYIVGRRRKT